MALASEPADPDRALLAEWKAGDLKAAEALLDRYFPALLRFFRNKAPIAVEDLVQETLLECVRSHGSFRETSSFKTFLFAVANNVLKRHYRRVNRGDLAPGFTVSSVAALEPSPSALVADAEQHRLLLAALRCIPLEHQLILELQYWEELSSSEIAEILDCPAATVRTRQRKAKQLLMEQVLLLAATPELSSSVGANFDGWILELRGRLGTDVP